MSEQGGGMACRTCLQIISPNKIAYSFECRIQNNQILDMLMYCFPEIDVYVARDPHICEKCLKLLVQTYQFKQTCLHVEGVIQSYQKTNKFATHNNMVNLQRVVIEHQLNKYLEKKIGTVDTSYQYTSSNTKIKVLQKPIQKKFVIPINSLLASTSLDCNNTETISTTASDLNSTNPMKIITALPFAANKNGNISSSTTAIENSDHDRTELTNSTIIHSKEDESSNTQIKSVQNTPLPNIEISMESPSVQQNIAKNQKVITEEIEEIIVLSDDESNVDESSVSNQIHESSPCLIINDEKNNLKRTFSETDIIQEILTNGKKLRVDLNPNLPYLHKNKSLVIRIKKSKMIYCNFCEFVTIDARNRKKHYSKIHQICKLCDYKWSSKKNLNEHLKMNHVNELMEINLDYSKDESGKSQEIDDENNKECPLCYFSCISFHDIQCHVLDHVGNILTCPICDLKFMAVFTLSRHVEQCHNLTVLNATKVKSNAKKKKILKKETTSFEDQDELNLNSKVIIISDDESNNPEREIESETVSDEQSKSLQTTSIDETINESPSSTNIEKKTEANINNSNYNADINANSTDPKAEESRVETNIIENNDTDDNKSSTEITEENIQEPTNNVDSNENDSTTTVDKQSNEQIHCTNGESEKLPESIPDAESNKEQQQHSAVLSVEPYLISIFNDENFINKDHVEIIQEESSETENDKQILSNVLGDTAEPLLKSSEPEINNEILINVLEDADSLETKSATEISEKNTDLISNKESTVLIEPEEDVDAELISLRNIALEALNSVENSKKSDDDSLNELLSIL